MDRHVIHSIALADHIGAASVRVQHYSSYLQVAKRIGEARKPGPPGDVDDPNAAFDVDEYDCVEIESTHGLLSQPEVELSVTFKSW